MSPRTARAVSHQFYTNIDPFEKDAIALFNQTAHGHMGVWEYGPSLFQGDPAGGGDYWADLVRYPGQYYVTQGDIETISWAVKQNELQRLVADIETVVELGPGTHESIVKKTIPFLNACPRLKQYIAFDVMLEDAAHAAKTVKSHLAVKTGIRSQDYMNAPMPLINGRRSALIMWGSTLGNIEGAANENPFHKLVRIFENFRAGLQSDDLVIICMDTEQNEEKILKAYNEPSLRATILSVIHRLKRDGHVTGQFDPKIWRHESVWFPAVGQCAHMIYPVFDQMLNISGRTIHIPAWRRFISNNSYKFSQEILTGAIQCAGYKNLGFLQKGPIALLIAQKI